MFFPRQAIWNYLYYRMLTYFTMLLCYNSSKFVENIVMLFKIWVRTTILWKYNDICASNQTYIRTSEGILSVTRRTQLCGLGFKNSLHLRVQKITIYRLQNDLHIMLYVSKSMTCVNFVFAIYARDPFLAPTRRFK